MLDASHLAVHGPSETARGISLFAVMAVTAFFCSSKSRIDGSSVPAAFVSSYYDAQSPLRLYLSPGSSDQGDKTARMRPSSRRCDGLAPL